MKYLYILSVLFLFSCEDNVQEVIKQTIITDTTYVELTDTLIKTKIVKEIVIDCPDFISEKIQFLAEENNELKQEIFELNARVNALKPYLLPEYQKLFKDE